MQYKNTKTGTIINVQSVIHGGDWIAVDEEQPPKVKLQQQAQQARAAVTNDAAKVAKAATPQTVVASGDDFDAITVKEIKQELDANGVKYSKTAKKSELYKLMMEA